MKTGVLIIGELVRKFIMFACTNSMQAACHTAVPLYRPYIIWTHEWEQ